MTYKKILVDNIVCIRRFHIAYDTEGAKLPQVTLQCPHCGIVVFQEENHPRAALIREENLVQTAELSENRLQNCQFRDTFSPTPIEK